MPAGNLLQRFLDPTVPLIIASEPEIGIRFRLCGHARHLIRLSETLPHGSIVESSTEFLEKRNRNFGSECGRVRSFVFFQDSRTEKHTLTEEDTRQSGRKPCRCRSWSHCEMGSENEELFYDQGEHTTRVTRPVRPPWPNTL
jgi:hypothetical protein